MNKIPFTQLRKLVADEESSFLIQCSKQNDSLEEHDKYIEEEVDTIKKQILNAFDYQELVDILEEDLGYESGYERLINLIVDQKN